MSEKNRRVLLGRIGAAHGVRGDVLVECYTAEPQNIAAYGPLESEDGRCRFELKVVRATPKGVVARVAGVTDRNAAEALRGTALYIERARLPANEEGEFYHADLVGLRAENGQGKAIGTIAAVVNYGAGDLLEIRLEGSRKTELVPFTDAFVPTVDIAGGRAVVLLPPSEDDEEDDESGAL
jgi:16S rRNA processing protein RimM